MGPTSRTVAAEGLGTAFRPLVTISEAVLGRLAWSRASSYVVAQFVGAIAGVMAAHMMFSEPLVTLSVHERRGVPQLFSESVATCGLITLISSVSRTRPSAVPFAVGAYIVSAYWFTSSTSFANPAVTVARALTDTFAGIRPLDVPAFVFAQTVGAALAMTWLRRPVTVVRETADHVAAPDRSRSEV